MKEKHIGLLCLQETHLTEEHKHQIEHLFSHHLLVLNSHDLSRPGNSVGVAFILNKELTNTLDAKMTVIIPGCATVLTISWHNEKKITILNTYVPNSPSEYPTFWEKITIKWAELQLSKPDIMLGDFNLMEDPIDHAPAYPNNEPAITTLRDLRTALRFQDT